MIVGKIARRMISARLHVLLPRSEYAKGKKADFFCYLAGGKLPTVVKVEINQKQLSLQAILIMFVHDGNIEL